MSHNKVLNIHAALELARRKYPHCSYFYTKEACKLANLRPRGTTRQELDRTIQQALHAAIPLPPVPDAPPSGWPRLQRTARVDVYTNGTWTTVGIPMTSGMTMREAMWIELPRMGVSESDLEYTLQHVDSRGRRMAQ